MIKDLIKLANHLDKTGFEKEADYLDGLITKNAVLGIPDYWGDFNKNLMSLDNAQFLRAIIGIVEEKLSTFDWNFSVYNSDLIKSWATLSDGQIMTHFDVSIPPQTFSFLGIKRTISSTGPISIPLKTLVAGSGEGWDMMFDNFSSILIKHAPGYNAEINNALSKAKEDISDKNKNAYLKAINDLGAQAKDSIKGREYLIPIVIWGLKYINAVSWFWSVEGKDIQLYFQMLIDYEIEHLSDVIEKELKDIYRKIETNI